MQCEEENSLSCSEVLKGEPHEYYRRFSLCVLDIIRKLQQFPIYGNGLRECHILEQLKQICTLDGDIESQLKAALHHLEVSGLVMFVETGYQTMGPHAKICSSKTARQRRLAWSKIDLLNAPSCQTSTLPGRWNLNIGNAPSNHVLSNEFLN